MRATHGAAGHNTIASGIPTNTRIVETLIAIFCSSNPRNSKPAAIDTAIVTNRPSGANAPLVMAAAPTPSPAAWQCWRPPAPTHQRGGEQVDKLHRGVEQPRPERQRQRRADRPRQPLERDEAGSPPLANPASQ